MGMRSIRHVFPFDANWKNYPGKAWTNGACGCDPFITFVLLTTLRQLGGWPCERGVRSTFTQVVKVPHTEVSHQGDPIEILLCTRKKRNFPFPDVMTKSSTLQLFASHCE